MIANCVMRRTPGIDSKRITEMFITKDNVLICVVVRDKFHSNLNNETHVFSVILRAGEASLPKRIMHLTYIGYWNIQVFGTRIVLHNVGVGQINVTMFKGTIAVFDVWNIDSVPKTVSVAQGNCSCVCRHCLVDHGRS
jgi:hypothetical protein